MTSGTLTMESHGMRQLLMQHSHRGILMSHLFSMTRSGWLVPTMTTNSGVHWMVSGGLSSQTARTLSLRNPRSSPRSFSSLIPRSGESVLLPAGTLASLMSGIHQMGSTGRRRAVFFTPPATATLHRKPGLALYMITGSLSSTSSRTAQHLRVAVVVPSPLLIHGQEYGVVHRP